MPKIHLLYLVVVLLLCVPSGVKGQVNIELIWQEGLEKSNDTTKIDFFLDKAWELARIKPSISSEILNRVEEHFYQRAVEYKLDVWYYYRGIIEKNLGRFDQSDQYLEKYYDFQLQRKDKRRIATVQMARANLYSDQGLWSKSMQTVTESLNIYEDLDDTLGIIRASSKLGAILIELKRLDDAMKYHIRSLTMASNIKDTAEISIAYTNIGLVFEKQQNLDSALTCYQKSLELDEDTDNEYAMIYSLNNIANIYLKLKQPSLALPLSQKAYQSARTIGSSGVIHYSQNLLGSIYVQLGQPQKGISLMEKLLTPEGVDSKRDLSDLHGSLYQAYKEIGDIESAFYHLEKYHQLFDTLLNEDVTQQINNLEVKYQTEKTEQMLELANSEKEIAQLGIQSIQNRNYFLVAGLLLISSFLFYLFRLNKKIKNQNKIIQKSLIEKDTLLKEIHHRVKNNLQVISSLLSLQSKSEEDPNVVSALKLGQDRVRSMALIHQNLYEEDDLAGIEINLYFDKLIQSLFHSYNISPDRINLQTTIEKLHLDVETVIPLGLILNELITNALKYAFPDERRGTISVSLREDDNLLHLKVSDDGIGFDPNSLNKTSKSFGYRLINVFKQQLKANLHINADHGTAVDLQIKEYRRVG